MISPLPVAGVPGPFPPDGRDEVHYDPVVFAATDGELLSCGGATDRMVWQFLTGEDRRLLVDALAGLDSIQAGQNGRRILLYMAGLAYLLPELQSLANAAARNFTGELIGVLENGETLPDRPVSLLWAGFSLHPSSITTVLLEERSPDFAVPRCLALGEIGHLHQAGLQPRPVGLKANYD
jgi:hypothetical protein